MPLAVGGGFYANPPVAPAAGGILYFDSRRWTSNTLLTFDGTTLTVGALTLTTLIVNGTATFNGAPTAVHATQPEWFLTAGAKTWSVRYRTGSTQLSFTEVGVAEWFTITNGTGAVAFGGTLSAGTTMITGGLTVNSGALAVNSAGVNTITTLDAATAAASGVFSINHNSSGTPAAGFGMNFNLRLHSSTTVDTLAGQQSVEWVDATHATRKARWKLNIADTATREAIRADANGTNAIVTFSDTLDASAIGTAGVVASGGISVAKRSFLGTIGATFSGNVLAGVQDATAAAAGQVGEVLSATQFTYTNYTATATYQQVTTLSLTAGDWDIVCFGTLAANGSTLTVTANSIFTLSTTTASAAGTTEGAGDIAYVSQVINAASGRDSIVLHKRVNINATTSYFLNSQSTFTLGNPQFVGSIVATRIR